MTGRFLPFRPLLILAVSALFLWALWVNVTTSWPSEELAFVRRNSDLTYDQKMKVKLDDDFYAYTKFLRATVPEDAVVYLPPHATYPWPGTGNPGFINYFLYSRELVSGNLSDQEINPRVTHALLVWGETGAPDPSLFGWPKVSIPAKKIIYFDTKTGRMTVLENTIYRLNDPRNENAWGVIEVAK